MKARDVYTAIQRRARQEGRPTDELLTLYALERFLARLSTTPFRHDFVLKGGVLLAAHGLRRPTRDIDMQARNFPLDEEHLVAVTAAVANAEADDGLTLDGDAVTVEVIRDGDEYSGLRASVPATIWTHAFTLKLDVSTGDPMLPAPERIRLPTILGGEPITMLAHPLAMVVAEKTVTNLQRGTTSTRWRDLVDIGSLARTQPFLAGDLAAAATAVSAHREVALGPITRRRRIRRRRAAALGRLAPLARPGRPGGPRPGWADRHPGRLHRPGLLGLAPADGTMGSGRRVVVVGRLNPPQSTGSRTAARAASTSAARRTASQPSSAPTTSPASASTSSPGSPICPIPVRRSSTSVRCTGASYRAA
jgi:hypothetical protein